jgi:hypothetical protein
MPKADEPISIGDLYLDLTPEELAEAERRLDAYVALALHIWWRLEADPEAWAEFEKLLRKSQIEGDQKT